MKSTDHELYRLATARALKLEKKLAGMAVDDPNYAALALTANRAQGQARAWARALAPRIIGTKAPDAVVEPSALADVLAIAPARRRRA